MSKIPRSDNLRREILIVIAFTVFGAGLRLWSLDRLGLEHFDEGIYALAGLWTERPGGLWNLDPVLIPYAPPALPILIGLFDLAIGPTDLAAILVSIVAGSLTIPVIGWLGRQTFGPGAGAASSGILALAGPHVVFSRMAMTDALFLLAWLIALGLGARFLERPGGGRAFAFGGAVGVAQLCKYNGWLSGMIVVLAALLGLCRRSSQDRKVALQGIGWGMVAALTAALVYLPWYLFVEQHASYPALLDHHRSYLKGWDAWFPHWKVQLAQQVALSGRLVGPISWNAIGWSLAWIGAGIVVRFGPRKRWAIILWWSGLLIGAIAFGAFPNAPWWIALMFLPWLIASNQPAMRLLAAWWIVLTILTPLYHPYARLWLPLHAASWIFVAGLVVELFDANRGWSSLSILQNSKGRAEGMSLPVAPQDKHILPSKKSWCGILGILLAAGFQLGFTPGVRPLPGLLAPSDGLRIAVSKFDPIRSEEKTPVLLDLLARPALSFYLLQDGSMPVRVFADLETLLRSPVPQRLAIVDEVQAGRGLDEPFPGWSSAVLASDPLPLPVLLDLNPGASFGHSGPEEIVIPTARIWILWTAGIDPFRAGESP